MLVTPTRPPLISQQAAVSPSMTQRVQVFIFGVLVFGLLEVVVPVLGKAARGKREAGSVRAYGSWLVAQRDGGVGAGGEEFDVFEQGPVGEKILKGEVFEQGFQVHASPQAGIPQDGLLLRGKQERVVVERVIQGFDAVAVPGQKELFPISVPNGQGEHAVEAFHAGRAPLGIGMKQDFGVGAGAEGVSLAFEFQTQFLEIVYLSIEHDGEPAVRGLHGLPAQRRKIQNGQASMPKAQGSVNERTFPVRAAMGNGDGHALDEHRRGRSAVEMENTADAAHDFVGKG